MVDLCDVGMIFSDCSVMGIKLGGEVILGEDFLGLF
jgi:hypothetical protein